MTARPLVVAHRGGAGLRPENTLAAVAHAASLGADAVEVDVQLSADGEVVVHHDERLDPDVTRLNGAWLAGPGPRIRDLAAAEIARLDVGRPRPGSVYARRHPDLVPKDGESIPLLRHVIEWLKAHAPRLDLVVELKLEPAPPGPSDERDRLVAAVARLLDEFDVVGKTIAISFDWPALDDMRRRLGALRMGYLTYPFYLYGEAPLPPDAPPWAPETRETLRRLRNKGATLAADADTAVAAIAASGGWAWGPFHGDATPKAVAAARRRGLAVSVWTANTESEFAALVAAGVDAVTTDRPERLLAFLVRT